MKERNASPWELLSYSGGRFKKAFDEGDLEEGSIACGQVAGMINDIPSCEELIERIVTQAQTIIEPLKEKILPS